MDSAGGGGGGGGADLDGDPRFAQLLRPIKDLTENWSVDLNQILSTYIDQLADIGVTLDGEAVNFTKAALILQGTASVYSKKVEYLWQNVLKMLDLLASQKALEEADQQDDDGTGKKGRRKKGIHLQDLLASEFKHVVIEMSKPTQINLKSDHDRDSIQERKLALHFITVTPRQLIEKEGQEKSGQRVNLYAKNTHDLISHKEDFKINSQFVMSACTVGEDLSTNCELLQQASVSLCDEDEDTFMETHLFSQAPRQEEDDEDCGTGRGAPVDEDVPPPNSVAFMDQEDVFMTPASPLDVAEGEAESAAAPPSPPLPEKRKRRDLLQESLDEPKAPLTDRWEPVKPHEADNVKPPKRPRPVKKSSRIHKAPKPDIELKRAQRRPRPLPSHPDKIKVLVPVANIFIQDLEVMKPPSKRNNNFLKANSAGTSKSSNLLFPEFQDYLLSESKRRQDHKLLDVAGVKDPLLENDDQELENFNGFTDALEPVHEDFDVPGADDQFDDIPLPDPHDEGEVIQDELGSMGPPPPPSPSTVEAVEPPGDSDSYEDLVRKHVTDYLQQTKAYTESTDLAKRVSRWHELIRPRLERVEKRVHFDIHKYGSSILENFAKETVQEGEEEAVGPSSLAAADSRSEEIRFTSFAKGKDKEEVCRYFLSTLMLANTMNVELTVAQKVPSSDSTEEEGPRVSPSKKSRLSKKKCAGKSQQVRVEDLPMDCLSLKLLSKHRHHEDILRFNAENALMMGNSTVLSQPSQRQRDPARSQKRKRHSSGDGSVPSS